MITVKTKIIHYIYGNCFLLFIPVIIINILFTGYLPECYLKNISHIIIYAESIVRIILMALSALMIIDISDRTGKTGILIYIAGLVIYSVSWLILIMYPETVAENSIILQLSGYWTATIWLIGTGITGNKLFVKIPYHYIIYIILSILFGILHTCHGYILLAK